MPRLQLSRHEPCALSKVEKWKWKVSRRNGRKRGPMNLTFTEPFHHTISLPISIDILSSIVIHLPSSHNAAGIVTQSLPFFRSTFAKFCVFLDPSTLVIVGCVNSPPAARGGQDAGITQPGAHLLAGPCIDYPWKRLESAQMTVSSPP